MDVGIVSDRPGGVWNLWLPAADARPWPFAEIRGYLVTKRRKNVVRKWRDGAV
jgi:hypothetical protein